MVSWVLKTSKNKGYKTGQMWAYLICTPAGKVYVPVMQLYINISNCMGQVKPNYATLENSGKHFLYSWIQLSI